MIAWDLGRTIDVSLEVVTGDLSETFMDIAQQTRVVSWDIETTGLDWAKEQIATCQLCAGGHVVVVNQISNDPERLQQLLSSAGITKIFHHAMFDVRFMVNAWRVVPRQIVCTKVLSKIIDPGSQEHSLKHLVMKYFGASLDKGLRLSDWSVPRLSNEQIQYAVGDVVYLEELFKSLRRCAEADGRWELATRCFDFIPTQVQLDLMGLNRVFEY